MGSNSKTSYVSKLYSIIFTNFIEKKILKSIPAAKIVENSIFLKTLISVLFVSFIVMISAITSLYFRSLNLYISELNENSVITLNRIANAVSTPLWNFDLSTIEKQVLLELKDKNISAIVIKYVQGETGFIKNKFDETVRYDSIKDKKTIDAAYLKKEMDIVYGFGTAGTLEIYFTDKHIMQMLFYSFLENIIILLTVVSVIILIIFFVLKKLVLTPIVILESSVKQLANKDFSTRIAFHSSDEIGSLAKNFNIMAETIEDYNINLQYLVQKKTNELINAKKMASIGEMVAGVAHEINTPIGNAITAVSHGQRVSISIDELVESNGLSKGFLKDTLKHIIESFEISRINLVRIANLIDNFKKVALDRKNEEHRKILVYNYLDSLILSIKPKIVEKSITVSIECDKELVITSYQSLLSQVIVNLLMNSIIHGFNEKDDGFIKLSAFAENENMIIKVEDNGEGIAPDIMDKIYEPFFTTKRNRGGTGLGLNIVYNIVTYNLNGKVSFESVLNEKTIFTVVFPLNQASDLSLTA